MAVNLSYADKFVRQAVETWSSTQKHDLGFKFTDNSTGRTYRYVYCIDDNTATPVAGSPAGVYGNAGAAVTNPNYVTADVTDCIQLVPCGIFRGSPTAGSSTYGFIEERNVALPTTVKAGTVAINSLLSWAADNTMTSTTNTAADVPQAKALSAASSLATSVYIQWL